LRNKGNKFYQSTHGTVFRTKTKTKKRKKIALMKKMRNAIVPVSPKIPA